MYVEKNSKSIKIEAIKNALRMRMRMLMITQDRMVDTGVMIIACAQVRMRTQKAEQDHAYDVD